ncbi:MAG: hypothetical protein N7Q72_01250 [Spiroplasma sp. Tabriz.8]|nr:hypothetical protein [Spiroplasma sp. Tabriz.8]
MTPLVDCVLCYLLLHLYVLEMCGLPCWVKIIIIIIIIIPKFEGTLLVVVSSLVYCIYLVY